MPMRFRLIALFGAFALIAGTAKAHHSFAADYFEDQSITVSGELTQFDSPFGRANVGWTPEWVVWHPNRERIEALLAASRERGSISPVLAGAIARVDRNASATPHAASRAVCGAVLFHGDQPDGDRKRMQAR